MIKFNVTLAILIIDNIFQEASDSISNIFHAENFHIVFIVVKKIHLDSFACYKIFLFDIKIYSLLRITTKAEVRDRASRIKNFLYGYVAYNC